MFKPIGEIIPKSIKRAGLTAKLQDALVLGKFNKMVEEILGLTVQGKLKPLYLKQGLLVLACLDDNLVVQLKVKEKEIIKRINQEFKQEVVKELRFLE